MITTHIIGGVPRSGKTQLSKTLLSKHGIPYISTDLLREGLEIGVPSFGIYDGQKDADKAIVLWPYFQGILEARKYSKDPLVIEGTNFIPSFLNEITELPYIRICFLGYTDCDIEDKVQRIKTKSDPRGDWTDDHSDQELRNLVMFNMEVSKQYKEGCEKYGFSYFDTGANFEKGITDAEKYLLNP